MNYKEVAIIEILWLINWINSYIWQIAKWSNYSAWVRRYETVTAFNGTIKMFCKMSNEINATAKMSSIIFTMNIIELHYLLTIFMIAQFADVRRGT